MFSQKESSSAKERQRFYMKGTPCFKTVCSGFGDLAQLQSTYPAYAKVIGSKPIRHSPTCTHTFKPSMVVHTCNPRIREVRSRISLRSVSTIKGLQETLSENVKFFFPFICLSLKKKKKTHLLEVIQQFMKGKIIHLGSVFNLKFYSFTTNSEP